MGQYPGKSGFEAEDFESASDVEEFLETRQTGFGKMKAVRHSVSVEGAQTSWDIMPKPLGSDQAEWL
jgi:hypothetical protein